MSLRSIIYQPPSASFCDGALHILDQLLLPHTTAHLRIHGARDAFAAIKSMRVRGAPAIALVAALALAVENPYQSPEQQRENEEEVRKTAREEGEEGGRAEQLQAPSAADAAAWAEAVAAAPAPPAWDPQAALLAKDIAAEYYINRLHYLLQARPTAVNLGDAVLKLEKVVRNCGSEVRKWYRAAAEEMLEADVKDNEGIGRCGLEWIKAKGLLRGEGEGEGEVSVLTHCNTGSLATAGYGTALGVIRSLHAARILNRVYYTETRPYNQGSRLTGYELLHDGIEATLVTDSMAAALMRSKGPLSKAKEKENLAVVVVGADRVARNGDTANKIGTYGLAVLARHHSVRFLVAAPRTTIDLKTESGDEIVIEERAEREMLEIKGPVVAGEKCAAGETVVISTAAPGTRAWNPAFDVTPAELIDGIVTEVGVAEKNSAGEFVLEKLFEEKERGKS